MRSARNAREVLSLPPSYTLRTIGIIASPGGSATAQGRGEGAIDERAAHAKEAGFGDLARRLHQLAVGPGDVAADVVFAEMKDGAPRALPGPTSPPARPQPQSLDTIGLSGVEDTPARRATMAVTLPYYEFREVLAVRDADASRFTSLNR